MNSSTKCSSVGKYAVIPLLWIRSIAVTYSSISSRCSRLRYMPAKKLFRPVVSLPQTARLNRNDSIVSQIRRNASWFNIFPS